MKKTSLLLSLILLFGCGQDDSTSINTDLLFGKKWYLHSSKITEVGTKRDALISACKLDDDLEFRVSNNLILFYGTDKCSTNEPDSTIQTWQLNGNQLDLGIVEYEVVKLTGTALDLMRELTSATGPVIVEDFYLPR